MNNFFEVSFKTKIFETIKKFNMLKGTDTLVIGTSGGADSMAFLHFAHNNFKMNLISAHVNHALRGEEADNDELLVKNFCMENGIEFCSKKIDLKNEAKRLKIGLEEAGRMVRYEFFNELVKKQGAKERNSKIVTAHTLSDNIETFLLNFTRGSGLNGLCGIPPTRNRIIRPLINVSREEIEEYCRINSIKFVIDYTNLCADYTRNKFRLKIIPKLKKINPSLNNVATCLFENLRADNSFLENIAQKIFLDCKKTAGYDINIIGGLADSIKNRVIFKIFSEVGCKNAGSKHIKLLKNMIKNSSGAITLPGKINLQIKNNILIKFTINRNKPTIWEYDFCDINMLTEINKRFIIKKCAIREHLDDFDKNSKFGMLDLDKLPKNLKIRNKRPGDKFAPMNRNVNKNFKKFLNELKISIQNRHEIPVIAHKNEIIWAYKIGVSDKFKVDDSTKNVLIIFEE